MRSMNARPPLRAFEVLQNRAVPPGLGAGRQ